MEMRVALFWCTVPTKGTVHVDAGCSAALLNKKNLYAAGVAAVEGTFGAMDAVVIASRAGPIARCLINFNSLVRVM